MNDEHVFNVIVMFIVHRSAFIVHRSILLLLLALSLPVQAQTVRITEKPEGLVHGLLYVPVTATEPVSRIVLTINGVKWSEVRGRSATIQVPVGEYIRRLRIRAVGYNDANDVAGEDEMVVNDPHPPFRVRLQAPRQVPAAGSLTLSANVIKPEDMSVAIVEFFVGEQKVGEAKAPPYATTLDVSVAPRATYARVVARTRQGAEANDVVFFGNQPGDQIDVTLQYLPMSVASGPGVVQASDLTLLDNGREKKIEALLPAAEEPLYVILLIDYSESMLEELPVVKAAARQFAQALMRPQDRIAVVGFNQRLFWLTQFTNDFEAAAQSVDRVKPIGETHLYDSVVEMLFELQKMPGRHALVVLTDGVDQGSTFKLDHVVHYARYAGVPIYPIIKNKILSRWMRFGVGYLESRRLGAIARDTGATYFIIQKERELPAVYARLASQLRSQYQLVFYSDASAADLWHDITVTSRLGQRFRIPKGYFP
jgi:Ca-activated chloride channel family protein